MFHNYQSTDKDIYQNLNLSGLVDGAEQKSLWETAKETITGGIESMFSTTIDSVVKREEIKADARVQEVAAQYAPKLPVTTTSSKLPSAGSISPMMLLVGAGALFFLLNKKRK